MNMGPAGDGIRPEYEQILTVSSGGFEKTREIFTPPKAVRGGNSKMKRKFFIGACLMIMLASLAYFGAKAAWKRSETEAHEEPITPQAQSRSFCRFVC